MAVAFAHLSSLVCMAVAFAHLSWLVCIAVAFAHLSWLVWSRKQRETKISQGSSLSTSPELALWESDTTKFSLVKGSNIASSYRKNRRNCHSWEDRKVDREYDIVAVPSDGGCVLGSESDDSDWSIGWLEPRGPGFPVDDETDEVLLCLCLVMDVAAEKRWRALKTKFLTP